MSQPGNRGDPRIGDEEREQAIRALGDHFSRGRIDIHEYDERVTQATQARFGSELAALFADLPGATPGAAAHGAGFLPVPPPAHQPQPGTGPVMPSRGFPPQQAPCSDKSKVAAGLLQIFLPFGVGRFYTGHTGIAVGQLMVFLSGILTCGLGSLAAFIWCLVDGIVLMSTPSTDAHGRPLRS